MIRGTAPGFLKGDIEAKPWPLPRKAKKHGTALKVY